MTQAELIGTYVTDLHNVLNGHYTNKNEYKKAIRKIVNRIYQAGYHEGYCDAGRDEQGF